VIQVDRNERPLPFVDPELTAYYLETLRSLGGQFLPQHTVRSVQWDRVSQVQTVFENGTTLASDKVLAAMGRTANVAELELDAAGVTLTRAGHIQVDSELQTVVPGIYAAGDVIGPPALASTAMEQGRRAACHALGLYSLGELHDRIPVGIYTIPEMSSVGLDEQAARTHFGGVLVGRARFGEIARGQIAGTPHGLLKLVADPDGRRVVGVQIVGPGATELVHIGQMGLAAELDVDTYVDTVFNFPTMAEAYRVAALDIVRQRRRASGNEMVAAGVAELL
jgi:NAD(P) transhydrogenase